MARLQSAPEAFQAFLERQKHMLPRPDERVWAVVQEQEEALATPLLKWLLAHSCQGQDQELPELFGLLRQGSDFRQLFYFYQFSYPQSEVKQILVQAYCHLRAVGLLSGAEGQIFRELDWKQDEKQLLADLARYSLDCLPRTQNVGQEAWVRELLELWKGWGLALYGPFMASLCLRLCQLRPDFLHALPADLPWDRLIAQAPERELPPALLGLLKSTEYSQTQRHTLILPFARRSLEAKLDEGLLGLPRPERLRFYQIAERLVLDSYLPLAWGKRQLLEAAQNGLQRPPLKADQGASWLFVHRTFALLSLEDEEDYLYYLSLDVLAQLFPQVAEFCRQGAQQLQLIYRLYHPSCLGSSGPALFQIPCFGTALDSACQELRQLCSAL